MKSMIKADEAAKKAASSIIKKAKNIQKHENKEISSIRSKKTPPRKK